MTMVGFTRKNFDELKAEGRLPFMNGGPIKEDKVLGQPYYNFETSQSQNYGIMGSLKLNEEYSIGFIIMGKDIDKKKEAFESIMNLLVTAEHVGKTDLEKFDGWIGSDRMEDALFERSWY